MCHCLSFIAIPQRVASWRSYLRDIIERIIAYNGPFTELQIYNHPLNSNSDPNSRGQGRTLVLVSGQGVARPLPMMPRQYIITHRSSPMMPGQYSVKGKPLSTSSGKNSPRPPRDSGHGRPNPHICKKANFNSNGSNNGSVRNIACLFSQEGEKGTNQDAMIVLEVCKYINFPDLSPMGLIFMLFKYLDRYHCCL